MDLKISARVDVTQALINAKEIGQKWVIDSVEDRLIFFHVEGQNKMFLDYLPQKGPDIFWRLQCYQNMQ